MLFFGGHWQHTSSTRAKPNAATDSPRKNFFQPTPRAARVPLGRRNLETTNIYR